MNIAESIEELKKYIYEAYRSTYKKIGNNIFRGHLRALSTEIEDGIALFVSNVLNDCKVFIDPSIYIDGKNNRPDILVINSDNVVVSMMEIKSNMGWCRNASNVIDSIISNDIKFKKERKLKCEFSMEEEHIITYDDNVKLFLISLTDGNCSAKNHMNNKAYSLEKGIRQYNLFSGWYGELYNCEIEKFAEELLK